MYLCINEWQSSHMVLKVMKKIKFQNRFSRSWKSIEFGQNVHWILKHGKSNCKINQVCSMLAEFLKCHGIIISFMLYNGHMCTFVKCSLITNGITKVTQFIFSHSSFSLIVSIIIWCISCLNFLYLNFTEGKAVHYLCSVVQCVKLSLMIRNFEKWREVISYWAFF